jgi:hypothetical protein
MQTRETVEHDIRQLLKNEQLAVLSTEQQGQPYASLVAFAVTAGLGNLVFCTPKTTRKFSNLANNPRAAMLINNCRNQASDINNAVSVTAVGKAAEVVGTCAYGPMGGPMGSHQAKAKIMHHFPPKDTYFQGLYRLFDPPKRDYRNLFPLSTPSHLLLVRFATQWPML